MISVIPIALNWFCDEIIEFLAQVTQYFPRGEHSVSFKWKDYSPSIFNRLRDTFGIDNKDYLLSLTGDQ